LVEKIRTSIKNCIFKCRSFSKLHSEGATYWGLDGFKFVNQKYIRKAHSQGLKVIPWTVNSESDWRKLIFMGVDGIIIDDPEELTTFLKNRL